MSPAKNQDNKKNNCKLTPELYDFYAPLVYSKVLSIVHEDQIAEKIFEKVFLSAYINDETFPLRSPLLSLIDIAHEKSCKTIKALAIFNACCSGASMSITDKNTTA